MELLKQILTIVASVLPFLVGFLTFLVRSVKNGKAKKILAQTLKITEAIQPYVIEAERFVNYTGEEKKQYVITKVNQFAIDNGLQFDAVKVSEMIEQVVDTTKKVNQRDKDKSSGTPLTAESGS